MASEKKSVTEVVGEVTKMPRPLRRLPALPAAASIKALRAGVKKQLGMSDRVAGAVSTLFVYPDQIIPQLDNLRRMRIPGGDLLYIEGTVWVPRLMADFSNPRNAADYNYPAAADKVNLDRAVFTSEVTSRTAELSVKVSSRDELAAALNRSMRRTRENNELHPSIGDQGIMDAPYGVMVEFEFEDGSPPIAVPRVREGSTRTSWAQQKLGSTPEDTLFRMPSSARPMNDFIDEINQIVSKPAGDIKPTESARVRCATTNFILIVGFEPDEQGTIDLEEAIKVKVAQEHLNVKADWSDSAQDSVLADDCLAAASEADLLQGEDEYGWLAGTLPFTEAQSKGLAEHRDDRFAKLMWLFTAETKHVHDVIRQPIAFVLREENLQKNKTTRVQVRRTTKIPLAIQLTEREFRGTARYPDNKTFEPVRKVLENGAPIAMAGSWEPTNRSLTALAKAAQKDVDKGKLGPASIELAVRALYYAAIQDILRVPRNDRGPGSDRRKVFEVLQALATTSVGVQQLVGIVKDGRNGTQPLRRDTQGGVFKDGEQKPIPLNNDLVRYEIASRDREIDESDSEIDPFMDAQRGVQRALRSLKDSIRYLESIKETVDDDGEETGESLVDAQGLPTVTYESWHGILNEVDGKLQNWFIAGVKYAAKASQPARILESELDIADEDSDF